MFIEYCIFFFFQAEDGIRDGHVTGVQTCALPIYLYKNEEGAKKCTLINALCKILFYDIFKGFSCFKCRYFACWNLNFSTSLWVTAFTSSTVAYFKSSKTN